MAQWNGIAQEGVVSGSAGHRVADAVLNRTCGNARRYGEIQEYYSVLTGFDPGRIALIAWCSADDGDSVGQRLSRKVGEYMTILSVEYRDAGDSELVIGKIGEMDFVADLPSTVDSNR